MWCNKLKRINTAGGQDLYLHWLNPMYTEAATGSVL